MVLKATKRGVRSGNTLRASNSKYTKTYRKQSYLVRKIKSSANLRILQDFGVASDNVVYSLSKKGRWELPKVLKEHILLNGFSEDVDSPNVQLTENHKLRKTANCLGFYASKGPIKKAVPCKNRYFNVASVKKLSPTLPEKEEEGREKNGVEDYSGPEINVDVYHPSPMSSSITHNRKYIRPVNRTDLPVNATNKKTRRRKRNKRLDLNLLEDDFSKYDLSDDFFDSDEYLDDEEDPTVCQEIQRPESFFTASDLLKSAKRAKKIFDNGNRTKTKQNNEEIMPKAKIVYVDKAGSTEYDGGEALKKDSRPHGTESPKQINKVGFKKLMVPKKVVLSTSETQPEYLKFVYGDKYLECKTFPRTFVINVTDEVKDVMKQNPLFSYKAFLMDLTTFLIFTFDIYTAGSDAEEIFDVYLNANINSDTLELSTLFDFFTAPLDTIISRAVSQLKLYTEMQFERKKLQPKGDRQPVLDVWGKGKTPTISEEGLLEEALMESKQGSILEGTSFEALPPEVCFICYESMDENRPGIAMESCGHWFCRGCWREHLLHQNHSRLLCPEFNCKKDVDFTTLVQVVNISEVWKYLTQRKENLVQKQQKYCPNEKCGRLISVMVSDKQTNAVCDCGLSFCLVCFELPHWPAPCEASQKYWNVLKSKGIEVFQSREESVRDVFVQGKSCPKCNRFIEKEGGCYSMICLCGVNFCWGCRGIHGQNHVYSELCNQYKNGDSFRTKKKRIPYNEHLEENMKGESALLQVAVKQRSERASSKTVTMKRKINSLCQRFGILGRKAVSKVADMLADEELKGKGALPIFEQFLRNMMNLYFEMRQLAEYTAVFAQQNNTLQNTSRIDCILARLDSLAADIYSKLNQHAHVDIVSLVSDLLDIKNHCMNTVSALMRLIEK